MLGPTEKPTGFQMGLYGFWWFENLSVRRHSKENPKIDPRMNYHGLETCESQNHNCPPAIFFRFLRESPLNDA